MAFGAVGFILEPIIAALFQTLWELLDAAFNDVLPRGEVVARQVVLTDAVSDADLPVPADESFAQG